MIPMATVDGRNIPTKVVNDKLYVSFTNRLYPVGAEILLDADDLIKIANSLRIFQEYLVREHS